MLGDELGAFAKSKVQSSKVLFDFSEARRLFKNLQRR